MSDPNTDLAKVLGSILKPIVKEAVREAFAVASERIGQGITNAKAFLTVRQAAETSGLGASTIRLAIRRRQLRAQKVGRRVLIKSDDLKSFLEANPIQAITERY